MKKRANDNKESEAARLLREEEGILEAVAERAALMGVAELAKGVTYTEPIKTCWRPPRFIQQRPSQYAIKN